jgi:SAM-dependent methyltransferase
MLVVENTLRSQFEFERAAAQVLLSASASQRPDLYKKIYAEFYERFGGVDEQCHLDKIAVKSQIAFVERFLKRGRDTFFEVGYGSGELCIAVAKIAKNCIGVDAVGDRRASMPALANCTFLQDDVASFTLPDSSVDVAFSSQVLEHLHPDDCRMLIGNVFRALRPGGVFVNIVPNWLTGPHDVSAHFSPTAQGLHLHEYDNGELSALMRASGFTRCTSYVGAKGAFIPLPSALVAVIEKGLRAVPRALRKQAPVRALVGIRMSARKPS